jgi:hypothetical protein
VTKPKRYAAGRARALGLPTRGTTAPNRLRRVDRWIASTYADLLRGAAEPVVVDLGYGARPVTAVELHARLQQVDPRVQVVGIEIDPERVAAAKPAERPGLTFVRGGFELAGLRPTLVRALNVLRQYEEAQAAEAWQTVLSRTEVLVEGTCDEIGRRAAWIDLDRTGPRTLTLAAHLPSLSRPSDLAERLPKALIHHNVPGSRIHALLQELDAAWDRAASYAPFGNRQRWIAACEQLPHDTRRARFGELTVPWESVQP